APVRDPPRGGRGLRRQRAPAPGRAQGRAVCVPLGHRRRGTRLRRPQVRAGAAGNRGRADRPRLQLQRALPRPLPGHPAAAGRADARGVQPHRPGTVAAGRGGDQGGADQVQARGGVDVPQAFLALGDSYTIGEGIAEEGRWPVQLAAALRAQGADVDPPRIIATTGWTTAELDAGIDAAHAQAPIATDHAPVSLLAGVNDQYRGLEPEGFRSRFAALLQRAARFADGDAGRVLVLAIPDWGVTPFALAQGRDRALVASQIDTFNAVCHQEAERAGA